MKFSGRKSNPTLHYLNPLSTFKNLWKYRDLIVLLTQRSILLRYKGTLLGFFWMIATPILMLAVYLFVSVYIFKAQWSGAEFANPRAARALIMFCGITIFNISSETIHTSISSVAGNPNYVKKTIFPLEILPFVSTASIFFFGSIWALIILTCILIFVKQLCITVILCPLLFVIFFLLCSGISWFLASAGVYVRDTVHVTGILTQLLFFVTPICYNIKMVPERFRAFIYLNPLTVLISSTQNVLFWDRWPDWTLLGLIGLASLIIFQGGYYFFMKTKGWFADVL